MLKQISCIEHTDKSLDSFSLSRKKTMIAKLTLGCALFVALFANARIAQAADLGIGLIPEDAAFLSSTLRGREQYDRIVSSNAFASLKDLKSVKKPSKPDKTSHRRTCQIRQIRIRRGMPWPIMKLLRGRRQGRSLRRLLVVVFVA